MAEKLCRKNFWHSFFVSTALCNPPEGILLDFSEQLCYNTQAFFEKEVIP